MVHFFILTRRKILYFILVASGWNFFQWWMWKNSYVFYQWNINNGNAPSYFLFSLDVLEKCFGRATVYPPGQSWFAFPYGWVYVFIILFWVVVWYTLACGIDLLRKFRR